MVSLGSMMLSFLTAQQLHASVVDLRDQVPFVLRLFRFLCRWNPCRHYCGFLHCERLPRRSIFGHPNIFGTSYRPCSLRYSALLYVVPQLEHRPFLTMYLPQIEHRAPRPPVPPCGGTTASRPHRVHLRPCGVRKKVCSPHSGQIFPAIVTLPYVCVCVYMYVRI